MPPFTLKIHLPSGNPDGLRTVERSNWNGRGVVFPRAEYANACARGEVRQPGVYILQGDVGGNDTLYIGEGDPVLDRLRDHYAKKDFWTQAVFFVAGPGQLNKAHVQFLEAQLVARAKAAKRAKLENSNSPAEPTLSEADCADMEVFLHHILGLLPVLGIHAFEKSAVPMASIQHELTCKGRGVSAAGFDTPQGFVVRAGSEAAGDEAPSLAENFRSVPVRRAELRQNGVLVQDGGHLKFSEDYTFSSPSFAAAVVLGRNANGREEWKNAQGKTLKQIQEAQARSN